MNSIVLELQRELLNKNCDILQMLRRAHVIAFKLNLSDFDVWIQNELNGYKKECDLPNYRKLKGELKAKNPVRGWIPVVIVDKNLEAIFNEVPIYESISYLLDVDKRSQDGYFHFLCSAKAAIQISKFADLPTYMECAVFFSTVNIIDVVDKVKNRLLEWTLDLEKNGILGENMTFNEMEKESAKAVSQQINYYAPVINGNVNGSQIISGNNNVARYNEALTTTMIKEIRESLEKESISPTDKEDAIELLEDVSKKIAEKRKPNIIKVSVDGLKNFVTTVGANATASLVAEKIKDLF